MKKEPWYVKAFQEDYLRIYAHRTDEAAYTEVLKIIQLLNMKSPARVLDLCCGNGRHSRALTREGFKVTGVDLSEYLLEAAREASPELNIRYEESDVRELAFQDEFDYVLNLFTSFGYFEEIEENIKAFYSIHRALKQGGQFLIDFLNPDYVKLHLVPESQREVDQLLITEKRSIMGQQVIKQIEVVDRGEVRQYEERVNLFSKEQMEEMLREAGLTVRHYWGDLDQQSYDRVTSPRMIIIGKK